jgi:cohesin complex subunit SA-1/2
VIQVLGAIDGHSLLEDEEREKLCLLLFDEQAKVRKAVSGFVRGVWEDVVEERLLGKKAGEKAKEYAGMKALAILLVKWAKALDRVSGDDEEESDDQREGGPGGGKRKARAFAAVLASGQKGRTALAVEALWDAVDAVRDWEGILQILLLDHSAAGEDDGERQGRRKANGTATKDSSVLDEVWRLEEVEESALLEVLVASLRRAKADASVPTKKVSPKLCH